MLPIINFYDIQLSFDRVKDLALRKRLNELPTNFHLPARDIELLKAAAKDLLQQSEQFQKLMNGLQ